MKKSKILEMYEQNTGITYKHQPLFVGDVYKNEFGVFGIVIFRDGKYLYAKTNSCEHVLPEDKAGMNNSTFVANVIQDEELMKLFIKNGIIKENEMVEEQPKEEKGYVVNEPVEKVIEQPKKTKKVKDDKPVTLNIYQKINEIRKAWSETDMEKEGKGKAGGGAKYQYYKPQQIIDFCLSQELKHNLYSKFSVLDDKCYYELVNLDNINEKEMVMCPFDVPRKMAASEAQQVGAAMTYHNRRLAMMMYKIEDNSKESLEVMDNANYTEPVEIPAPPVMSIPNVPVTPIVPPVSQTNEQPSEAPNVAVVPPSAPPTVPTVPTVPAAPPKEETVTTDTIVKEVGGTVVGSAPWEATPPVQTQSSAPKMGSIESLY